MLRKLRLEDYYPEAQPANHVPSEDEIRRAKMAELNKDMAAIIRMLKSLVIDINGIIQSQSLEDKEEMHADLVKLLQLTNPDNQDTNTTENEHGDTGFERFNR